MTKTHMLISRPLSLAQSLKEPGHSNSRKNNVSLFLMSLAFPVLT
jgi:hypothetical protein